MKVLIVGLGSIAQKHIFVLREIVKDVGIYALRSSKNSAKHEGVIDIYDWKDLIDYEFHFALIASPSSMHLEHIERLSSLNIPLMVEKPLFINIDQINSFENNPSIHGFLYTACNFRFHPLIQFLKSYLDENRTKINEVNAYCGSFLPDWRPNQDYTTVYSSIKELGGGVNLDLVHEPDYLIYLFGTPSSTSTSNRKVSNLNINSYDSCISLFQYEDFQAQIVLNYFRKDTKRTLEIILEDDTILVDFVSGEIVSLLRNKVLFKDNENSIYTTYREQMKYFLSCIDKNEKPMNASSEAIKILKCIL